MHSSNVTRQFVFFKLTFDLQTLSTMLHRQVQHSSGFTVDNDCGVAYSLKSNATGNQTTNEQKNFTVNNKEVKVSDTVDIPANQEYKPQASVAVALKSSKASTNDVLFDTEINSHHLDLMTESEWSVDLERKT
jgi:hypothetical protein